MNIRQNSIKATDNEMIVNPNTSIFNNDKNIWFWLWFGY